ncbi:integrase [Nibricoccus aquaticus]|uniref:Integrase n=1 Tax=Nibricoccus aquaticus TaxID=2576891 RepID=A0A290QMU6_9BACT|nr:tyrosine-type recombinase/integrase [Nibricoccus aquaticus]ATC65991.1 integrase [Nibricoccus aquaticus]
MKNLSESEVFGSVPASGQNVGQSPKTTTHGAMLKLKQRIQRNTRKYFGRPNAPYYLLRIQCRGCREWFELGSDLDSAAKLAREIDCFLRLHTWEETRSKYKPAFAAERSELTVGRYIELVGQHGHLDPCTLYTYAARFRRIVSGIRKIKFNGTDKFPGKAEISRWRAAVDGTRLNTITPKLIAIWRDEYVARFPANTPERIRVEHTANGVLRNARALFAKRVMRRVLTKCSDLVLPSPLPFDAVEFLPERESDYFYTSEVDAKKLIEAAFAELSGNQLVIFVLAIGAGLRRNEIDKLLWSNVELATGTVTIAPTKYGRLKSDSSVGKIRLESQFAEVLRKHAEISKGEFVLISDVAPRPDAVYRQYRCTKDFKALCLWLKGKGITRSTSRIHTLRKEFGSHLADRKGILAASSGLRHSTIGVTRKFYVSSKIEPTSFFSGDSELKPLTAVSSNTAELMKILKNLLEEKAV